MKNKILIFTRFSKKNGIGHLIRSQRLFNLLKKKFNCRFYINKNNVFISNKLNQLENKTLIILDFKIYQKKLILNKNNLFYILFDQNKIKKRNLISINPLNLNTDSFFNGPRWFIFPKNFLRAKKEKTFKKKFKIFISQGGTDSNNNLKKIIRSLNINDEKIDKVFVKIPKKNYVKIKHKKISYYYKLNNLFNVLNKTDIAISGCGNFSYEINFFKIPTIYISNEAKEIVRGKKYKTKGIGKFYRIKQLNKALEELKFLMNNKKYYNNMVNKRKNMFKKDRLKSIDNLVSAIFKKNEF